MLLKALGNKSDSHRWHESAGFGLVEVVVSVGIIGLVLTSVASGLAFSLKTSAETKFRGIALSKNQEVFEAIRRERIIRGWDSFITMYGSGVAGTYTYCLNETTALDHDNFPPTAGACADTADWDGNDYIRELVVDTTVADEVSFTSTVYWQGRDKQIQLTLSLKKW
jgi:type II secretory pathway pseudopilin PulG